MRNCVEVADRVRKVDVIEEVEELGAQLDVLRFTDREAFDDGEVHVSLSRPAQDVASDVADVCAERVCDSSAIRAWDHLAGLYHWTDERERVEEVSRRNIGHRRATSRTRRPAWPGESAVCTEIK